jgi:hypothetical protein
MRVILKNVRLAFPKLFEATKADNNENSKKRFGATLLIAPGSENDKAIRAAIQKEATEKWGAKAPAMLKAMENNNTKYCYQDGTIKSDKYEGFEGMWALSANRNEEQGAPAVVDRDKSPLGPASGKPYAGCYVNASVDIWAQTGQYMGIRCTLVGIQFAGDGDAFAGAPATADDFDDLGESVEDPLAAFAG